MTVDNAESDTPRSRAAGALGSAWAAVMGVLPHVLHHVGPLAGAAFIAGTTGTIVFGLLAFALMIPLLLRVRRHCGSWRLPVLLLAMFVAVWSVSTWVVGPWVNDQFTDAPQTRVERTDGPDDAAEHERHHDEEDT